MCVSFTLCNGGARDATRIASYSPVMGKNNFAINSKEAIEQCDRLPKGRKVQFVSFQVPCRGKQPAAKHWFANIWKPTV